MNYATVSAPYGRVVQSGYESKVLHLQRLRFDQDLNNSTGFKTINDHLLLTMNWAWRNFADI